MSMISIKFQEFTDYDEEKLLSFLDKSGWKYEFLSDIY